MGAGMVLDNPGLDLPEPAHHSAAMLSTSVPEKLIFTLAATWTMW
jgi:hypothetical protein